MTPTDNLGHRVTGANADSLALYETGLHELQCFIGDPAATVDKAIATSPGFVMAHALRAYLNLLGTEPAGIPVARESLKLATSHLPATERERGHLLAINQLIEGRWQDAGRTLEDVAIENPRDALALQVGHQIDFFRGDSRMLRDRIARARPAWSPKMPGYHAILGMHAFGLEEMGHYVEAEVTGRKSVELEPRDTWGQHAVAHVMEMQGRHEDGIGWMRANEASWSKDSFFSVHNWWHLALYHLDLGEIDEVLKLFDGPIYSATSKVVLDMIDASALLWRLHLRGVDVGHRWRLVADAWEPIAGAGNYAFNDAHAMMAFVGAGRREQALRLLEAQREAIAGKGDNVMFTRDVGFAVTKAIHAFGNGAYAETVSLLRPVRNIAARFGGSHAQRDVIDLTLIEAAFRSGQSSLAAALSNERVAVKPTSPLARLFVERAQAKKAA